MMHQPRHVLDAPVLERGDRRRTVEHCSSPSWGVGRCCTSVLYIHLVRIAGAKRNPFHYLAPLAGEPCSPGRRQYLRSGSGLCIAITLLAAR